MSDIGQLICPELDTSLRLPTPAFALSLRHYRSSSDAIDQLRMLPSNSDAVVLARTLPSNFRRFILFFKCFISTQLTVQPVFGIFRVVADASERVKKSISPKYSLKN